MCFILLSTYIGNVKELLIYILEMVKLGQS